MCTRTRALTHTHRFVLHWQHHLFSPHCIPALQLLAICVSRQQFGFKCSIFNSEQRLRSDWTSSPPLLIFRPIRFFVYRHTTIVANKWGCAEVRGICTDTAGATCLIGSSNLVKLAGIIVQGRKKTQLEWPWCPHSTGCYYWCFIVLLCY